MSPVAADFASAESALGEVPVVDAAALGVEGAGLVDAAVLALVELELELEEEPQPAASKAATQATSTTVAVPRMPPHGRDLT